MSGGILNYIITSEIKMQIRQLLTYGLIFAGSVCGMMYSSFVYGQATVEVPGSENQSYYKSQDSKLLYGLSVSLEPLAWQTNVTTTPVTVKAGNYSGPELCSMICGHLYHGLFESGCNIFCAENAETSDPLTAGHLSLHLHFSDDGTTLPFVRVIPSDPASTESQALARSTAHNFAEALGAMGLPGGVPQEFVPDTRANVPGKAMAVFIGLGNLNAEETLHWFSKFNCWATVSDTLRGVIEKIWKTDHDRLLALTVPAIEKPHKESTTTTLVKKCWKGDELPKTQSELQGAVNAFKAGLTDRTFLYFDVHVTLLGDGVVELDGACNNKHLIKVVENLMYALGRPEVRNKINILPASYVSDRPFGTVLVPEVVLWDKPQNMSVAQTQLFIGEPVYVLDATQPASDWLLVLGGDGYLGWVESKYILRQNTSEFAAYHERSLATLNTDMLCETSVTIRLPEGAALPVAERVNSEGIVMLALPDGSTVPVAANKLNMIEGRGAEAARHAITYYMTPYVFGGRAHTGVDCSGLSGIAWKAVGVVLGRDAFQQITVGRVVGMPWDMDRLKPGDLLFFIDDTGRTSHVAVSLGGKRFIHAETPSVRVGSFNPSDPYFEARRLETFVIARRPMM